MIRIAVVGEIGSGKSHVARQFGYPVFNADNEVTKIYRKSRKFHKKIKKLFPNHTITFPVKKRDILKAIRKKPSDIKKIVKIIHPEIRYKMHEFINSTEKLENAMKVFENENLIAVDTEFIRESTYFSKLCFCGFIVIAYSICLIISIFARFLNEYFKST